MKSRSAIRITLLRPKVLAIWPLIGETRRANRDVEAAMRDFSTIVNGCSDSDVPIETNVADMTPVSSWQVKVSLCEAIEE